MHLAAKGETLAAFVSPMKVIFNLHVVFEVIKAMSMWREYCIVPV
jgi:hypothetical protein